jgi:hypothetical protein
MNTGHDQGAEKSGLLVEREDELEITSVLRGLP